MPDHLKNAREAFLDLISDASRFEEDPDEHGCSYHITTDDSQLRALLQALGIAIAFNESCKAAITRALNQSIKG